MENTLSQDARLPRQFLSEAFGYLSLKNRLNIELVSREWCYISRNLAPYGITTLLSNAQYAEDTAQSNTSAENLGISSASKRSAFHRRPSLAVSLYYEHEGDLATLVCEDVRFDVPMPIERPEIPQWRFDPAVGHASGWGAITQVQVQHGNGSASAGAAAATFPTGFGGNIAGLGQVDSGVVDAGGSHSNSRASGSFMPFTDFGDVGQFSSPHAANNQGDKLPRASTLRFHSTEQELEKQWRLNESVLDDLSDLQEQLCDVSGGAKPAQTASSAMEKLLARQKELFAVYLANHEELDKDPFQIGQKLYRFLARFGPFVTRVRIGGKSSENDALNLKPWRRAIIRPELLQAFWACCPELLELRLNLCRFSQAALSCVFGGGFLGSGIGTGGLIQPKRLCLHDCNLESDVDLSKEKFSFLQNVDDRKNCGVLPLLLDQLSLSSMSGPLLDHLCAKIQEFVRDSNSAQFQNNDTSDLQLNLKPSNSNSRPALYRNLCFSPQIFDLMTRDTMLSRVGPIVQAAQKVHLMLDISHNHRLEYANAWFQIVSLVPAQNLTTLELTLGCDDLDDRLGGIEALANTRLRSLTLQSYPNALTDASFEVVCAHLPSATLTRLIFLGNAVSHVQDFTPLVALTNLRHLTVCHAPYFGQGDISGFLASSTLRSLCAIKCGFTSEGVVGCLDGLPKLRAFQIVDAASHRPALSLLRGHIFPGLMRCLEGKGREGYPGAESPVFGSDLARNRLPNNEVSTDGRSEDGGDRDDERESDYRHDKALRLEATSSKSTEKLNSSMNESNRVEASSLEFFTIRGLNMPRIRPQARERLRQFFDEVQVTRNRIWLKKDTYTGSTRLGGDAGACSGCGVNLDFS